MATCPPPTIPTIYPFLLQSIPNLTNSPSIAVGMYMYSITYRVILITSPAAILHLPINLFCPLDTALVLTSDNFHSISPPLLPSSCLALIQVALICNSSDAVFIMCSHTITLFRSRKTSVIVETFQLSFHVFMFAFHPEISLFFW